LLKSLPAPESHHDVSPDVFQHYLVLQEQQRVEISSKLAWEIIVPGVWATQLSQIQQLSISYIMLV